MLSAPNDTGLKQGDHEVRLRVTVVTGFSGSGKSTLVRRVMAGRGRIRLAVLVHDRSDASLDADDSCGTGCEVFHLGESMAELVQRCVGCSLRESLADAMVAIARLRRFDRLIIECSALVEPVSVAELFNEARAAQAPLAELARLDHIVTVVDAESFWTDVRSTEDLHSRGLSGGTDDVRTVSELLVEQVEYSTLVVISKSERVSSARQHRVTALVRRLNPEADVLQASSGQRVVDHVLSCRSSALEMISFQPGWVKLLEKGPIPRLSQTRWTTGVFRATRPFHPTRFWQLVEEDWFGVERCKGYFWLASQPERYFLWSQTAGVRHYECLGDWWAATPREEWPTDPDFEAKLHKEWSVEFGDRRQALACIGYQLDQQELFSRLRDCLLTPSELLLGEAGWRQFDDPFARATQEAGTREDEAESD